jgi:hypothetical protein
MLPFELAKKLTVISTKEGCKTISIKIEPRKAS